MSAEKQFFKQNLSKAAGMKDDHQLVISVETVATALYMNQLLCLDMVNPGLCTVLGAYSGTQAGLLFIFVAQLENF